MKLGSLLACLLIGAPHARANLLKSLIGYPTDEVQMNAVCQALLARGGGADRERAIAIFRDLRIRRLGRPEIAPSVERTFGVDARAGLRKPDKLAGHLLGVERWMREGHGAVYGFVLTGPNQILAHERRLTELRESFEHDLRESNLGRGAIRLGINLMTYYLLSLGVPNGPAVLAAMAPVFLVINPYSANRTLLIQDFAEKRFHAARARLFARPDAENWEFSTRTYRVFNEVNKAVATLDLSEVTAAVSLENWWRLSPLLSPIETTAVFLKKGWTAAKECDAQSQTAYVLVDTLSRFDPDSGEPQVVLAVRTTTVRPNRVFAAQREPRVRGVAGSLPTAK